MDLNSHFEFGPFENDELSSKNQTNDGFNNLLPYSDKLENEAKSWLSEIKENLGKAAMLGEINPGCTFWAHHLTKYIDIYGLKFSKEDHVAFIHLMYKLLTTPNLDIKSMEMFAYTFHKLIKKKHLLTRDDLVLEWRPLYDLSVRLAKKGNRNFGHCKTWSCFKKTLVSLCENARFYFPETATQEMLDVTIPHVSPFYVPNFESLCTSRVIPVFLPPEKSHLGYKLWLDDLMTYWTKGHVSPLCEVLMMHLLGSLASYNIGQIDWEPYIPFIFSKITRFLNLACFCASFDSKLFFLLDYDAMTSWIVSVLGGGSSCQFFLDLLLKSIEIYSLSHKRLCSSDKEKRFLRSLTESFMKRLRFERYKNPSWVNRTPESHKLTEEDIDRFVLSTMGLWKKSVYYLNTNCPFYTTIIRNLATLRPEIIIPSCLKSFYVASSATEPGLLRSSMISMITVAKPMIEGVEKGFPEGPQHVIPVLMETLPGIDANDVPKTILTFELISVFVSLVPIVDSSNASEYYSDLTESETEICRATGDFKDFVSQFFHRIFNFIDSSTEEADGIGKGSEQNSRLNNSISSALSAVSLSVLSQCSTSIFTSALLKLHDFLTGRILETRVSGFYLARICRSFSTVNPEETAKFLLPYLCDTILRLTKSPDVQTEETLDKNLLYNMTILSELFYTREGSSPFMDKMLEVFDRTLHLSCESGVDIATKTLGNYLMCLTTTFPKIYRSTNRSLDLDVKDYLPIREWGKKFHIRDVGLEWKVPGPEETACVQQIVWKYLPVELERLEKHISNEQPLTRGEILNCLKIISEILKGSLAYPVLEEEILDLEKSSVKTWSSYPANLEMTGEVNMPDGSNIRQAVMETVSRLQMKLLECTEDDTKSLNLIILIFEKIFFDHIFDKYYRGIIESFSTVKKSLQDPLLGNTRQVRVVMIGKALNKHKERRGVDVPPLNETRKLIILNLMRLSCSYYSQVRKKAQAALSKVLSNYHSAYKVLIPELVKNLQMDSVANHKMFKGTLNVLLSPPSCPIIIKPDWEVLSTIWPALLKSTPSEKNSIITLMDKISRLVYENVSKLTIENKVTEACVEIGRKLYRSCLGPSGQVSTDEEIGGGVENSETNVEKYYRVLDMIMVPLEENKLHWRYYELGIKFMHCLYQEDVKYPARAVALFLNALINDSVRLRKIVMKSVNNVLIQQRRPFKKVVVDLQSFSREPLPESFSPGFRADNSWLEFTWETCPRTAEAWDELRYLNKVSVGYFQMPKEIELYAPSKDQPPFDRKLEEMTPEEREVRIFFSSPKNMELFMKYLSLEEKTPIDVLKNEKDTIFKYLFRNHGDCFLDVLKPHLEKSIDHDLDSYRKCGIEVMKGLVLGSKNWPFEKVSRMWEFLSPLINKGLSISSPEIEYSWGGFFRGTFNCRDPKRLHWLVELSVERLLRNEASYRVAARLYMFYFFLETHNWKAPKISNQVLERVRPYLAHPFQNYRIGIARSLSILFRADVTFPNEKYSGPRISDFMEEILPKIEPLYSLQFSNDSNKNGLPNHNVIINNNNNNNNSGNVKEISDKVGNIKIGEGNDAPKVALDSKEKENSISLFKTVALWIHYVLESSSSEVRKEYYSIFPLLLIMESYEQDDEIGKICSDTINSLAKATIDPELIPFVLSSVSKVYKSGSYSARKSVLNFLKIFVTYNMFPLAKNPKWREETIGMVLHMLEDEWIEVREEAAALVNILIYSGFIEDTDDLLKSFAEKLRKKKKNNLKSSDYIRTRHAAILGLCSFILCSPYGVTDEAKQVFSILGDHLHDTEPIPSTILKVINSFKKTHSDWKNNKRYFTEEEFEIFDALVVPPSYVT